MALVYLACNRVNGNRYIGVTSTGLARRVYMHMWNATSCAKGAKTSGVFNKAIRKYGKNAFEFSVLEDGLSFPDALQRERVLIAEMKPEYNVAAGGHGPTEIKWTPARHKRMAIALRAAWTDERRARVKATIAAREPSARQLKIRAARLALPKTFRSVVCLNDGRWFERAKNAASAYGLHSGTIASSASGKEVSTKGLFFAYSEEPLSSDQCAAEMARRQERLAKRRDKSRLIRSRPVVCITDGRAFPSGYAAAQAYGLAAMTIVHCCKGGSRTKTGMRFRYADEVARDKHAKTPEELAAMKARHRAAVKRACARNRKSVVCLDDGRVYPSIGDAARAYETTIALVSAAIYRNGRSGGRRFQFVATRN